MGKNSKNMYKTIRQGENSLQYTILPQNDDFRLEGKIKSVESTRKPFIKRHQNGKASSSTSSTVSRRRRSFFAYLGVIFICTVILGAILIPFLISAECMPNPKEWFLRTAAALTGNNEGNKNFTKTMLKIENPHKADGPDDAALIKDNLMQANNQMSVGQMVKIINQNGMEKFILKVNRTKISSSQTDSSKPPTLIRANKTQPQDNASTNNEFSRPQLTITVQALNVNNNTLLEQQQANNFTNNKSLLKNDLASNKYETIVPIETTNSQKVEEINEESQEVNLNVISKATTAATATATTSTLAAITLLATKNASTTNLSSNRINQVPLLKGSGNSGGSGNVGGTSGFISSNSRNTSSINSNRKPAIPPVLVKNYSKLILATSNQQSTKMFDNNNNAALQDSNNHNQNNINTLKDNSNKRNETNTDWIQSHWPYIDPSTYFQWNSFKAEDSVLFPALLGFALIAIILIVTVCLVARNKRSIFNMMRQRNRNNIAENGAEDNATLLTGATISDDEE